MKSDNSDISIAISRSLYEKIEKRVKMSEFNSVQEYVTYVLEQVIAELEKPEQKAFTEEEEKKVEERLRDLGYL